MTLFVRSIQCLIRARLRPKIRDINETLRDHFRVLPIDIDVYRHMNHAKYLNYLEAARWGLQLQSGFLGLAMKRGWIGPLAEVQIEYYRPLMMFQKFEITTQFARFDEKWYYILQRVWSGEKEMARALIKGTIRKGRMNVPPSEYLTPLGFRADDIRAPEDVREWIQSRIHGT